MTLFSNSLRIRPHDHENVFSWSSKHWRSWRMPVLLKTRTSEQPREGSSTWCMEKCLHLRIYWQNVHQLFKFFFPTILTIFFKNFNEISFQLILWFWRAIFYSFFVLMSLTDRHWLMKINWKGIDFCFYFLFYLGLVNDEIFFIMSSGALFKVIKQFVKVVKHKIVCFTWLGQYYSSLRSKPLKKNSMH